MQPVLMVHNSLKQPNRNKKPDRILMLNTDGQNTDALM